MVLKRIDAKPISPSCLRRLSPVALDDVGATTERIVVDFVGNGADKDKE